MFKKQELVTILIVSIVLAFVVKFRAFNLTNYLYALLAIIIIITINTLAKKLTSYHLDTEIEVKHWTLQRYGFKPRWKFKNPINTGIILPIALVIVSIGYIQWLASLVFDIKPRIHRAARRHGLYTFSEMTEYHLGIIAASGIVINLIVAFIGYLFNLPEFAKLNIFYAFYNLIPFSDLDGNKIFFGSLILWSFLATITLIALGYVFLLI